MAYVVKRGMARPSQGGYSAPDGPKPAAPRVAMPGDFGEHKETITVYEPSAETIDTGLLDKDGNTIHRKLMQPIGLVRL